MLLFYLFTKNAEMLEQIIEKFEFMNSLIDILNPLELYEFLNHQKMLEVVDSDIRISENDLRSALPKWVMAPVPYPIVWQLLPCAHVYICCSVG